MVRLPVQHHDAIESHDEINSTLGETLEVLLEFTGASAGWIAIPGTKGERQLVARCGTAVDGWFENPALTELSGASKVREVPMLLNDLNIQVEPPVHSLLAHEFARAGRPAGTVVLANKPAGFTSHDATVLQSAVYQLQKRLARLEKQAQRSLNLLRSLTGSEEEAGSVAGVSGVEVLHKMPLAVALTDEHGQIAWMNDVFGQNLDGVAENLAQPLRNFFTSATSAALERILKTQTVTPGRLHGHVVLETRASPEGHSTPVFAYWRLLPMPQGPRFLFVLVPDAVLQRLVREATHATQRLVQATEKDWFALSLHPGQPVGYWDAGWEQRTGFNQAEVNLVPSEVLLDWLFPQQRDREFAADLLARRPRHPVQAYLEIAGRKEGRSLLCIFVPLQAVNEAAPHLGPWLMLACQPVPAAQGSGPAVLNSSFAAGLGQLLNHYLTIPLGLAEMAQEREDLPADVSNWFEQILESCLPVGRLLDSLQELTATSVNEMQPISLHQLLHELLQEYESQPPEQAFETGLELDEVEISVTANARMLRVILRHLFSNAVQALVGREPRRITIRLRRSEAEAVLEIEDSGAGLPVRQEALCFLPFFSTKGVFARTPSQAGCDAVGLGLTVCQHLIHLHSGHLELRCAASGGTIACLRLPRAISLNAAAVQSIKAADVMRQDNPGPPFTPHAVPQRQGSSLV